MSSGQGKFPLEVVTDNNLLRQRYEDAELEGKLPLYATTTSAQGVGNVDATQSGADGKTYVVGAVLPARELIHIPLHGQSNMVADQAIPPLSVLSTGWGNLRFTRGVATWSATDNPTAPELRAASGFDLVPLTAGTVETRANGLADALKARALGVSRYAPDVLLRSGPHVLITSSALGGRKLTELGPENHAVSDHVGGHWPTLFDDIKRARTAAADAGFAYKLPFWSYDQGESEGDLYLYYQGTIDTITNVRAGYKTKALTMVTEFSTRASALVGQPRPIPCLVVPPCSTLVTASPWLELGDESDLVKIVGPRYMTLSALNCMQGTGGAQTWGDPVHHTPDSHRWVGEMTAKVAHRIFVEGEEWKPLRALKAVKIDTNNVDITFSVPRPPLVIDTDLVARYNGYGFSMWSGSLDSPTGRQYATGVALQPDGRTIRVTFGSVVPAGAKLSLGITSASDLGSTPAITAVGTGANTANGFATHTVTFAGDIRALLASVSQDGAFYLRASGKLVEAVMRSVVYNGTDTVLTGETREIRTGGSYVAPSVGDLALFGRAFPGLNVRDSDPAASINLATAGPLAGKPYPLYNWCCQYDGLTVTGA